MNRMNQMMPIGFSAHCGESTRCHSKANDIFLFVLAAAGLVDAISWMVVTIYARDLGGSVKQAYGLTVLSTFFSFAVFRMKLLLGWKSDLSVSGLMLVGGSCILRHRVLWALSTLITSRL